MPPTISALVITKNEESNIGACLETLRWVDEVLIVDAESTDRTVEIASRYTQEIFIRPWSGYGPQKNFGIERAKGEWVLIVDADERIPLALREEIQAVLKAGPPKEIAGYAIPRRNFFYGRWIRGGGLYPDYQLRLFRKSAGRYDDTKLHEHLRLDGRIKRLAQPMDHHSMPTIRVHVRKMIRYTTLGAEEVLKRRTRVTALDLAARHLWTIMKTFVFRGGYRDGVHGVIVSLFAGMHTFVKYAKAWESLSGQNLHLEGNVHNIWHREPV
jgi:glycosyltransferase involved in cell wall biosynthesis